MRKIVAIFCAFCLFSLSTAFAQQTKGTLLRVLNLWSGNAGGINGYVDEALLFETMGSGETSAYISVDVGTHTVRIAAPDDDANLIDPIEVTVADGHNYTLVLAEQARAYVIDETNALRTALVQTASPVLILNASEMPIDLFFGTLSASLQVDAVIASDMPTVDTVFSAFLNGQVVVQEALMGLPNNYALFVITSSQGVYQLVSANYSALNAADFLRGLGIGGTNGLNLALAAFENANLGDELGGENFLTIFAPINAAVDVVNEDTLDAWLESRVLLENVMSYHVVAGAFSPFDALQALNNGAAPTLTTLQGEALTLTMADDGVLLVNGARLVGNPYRVRNGVIYPIDMLLQPSVLPEVTVLP